MTHADELAAGERFAFGENWASFLATIGEEHILEAEKSLKTMLGVHTLAGKSFVDAGSGSGLFSLAARRLGATVHSFDFDPQSVGCTKALRNRHFPEDERWKVEEGSVLDPTYLSTLGRFDVVYSWGVLHHTGQLWAALDNVSQLCRESGQLFIAVYNHMGSASRRWTVIKKFYCQTPQVLKPMVALAVMAPIQARSFAVYAVQGRVWRFFEEKIRYKARRGMSWWHDQIDWIGGYPYEDAKPEEVFDFVRGRGFTLSAMITCGGGIGCNQYVFTRDSVP